MKFRRLKDERGQASIFMALFVSTMILLFAFTTNIGMLVHAKINLQNAADAAAYAGAAVQARQLTSAAYLNWEMRRALKEFLYYYTIRSQYAAMPCFPLDFTGRTLPSCQAKFGQPAATDRHSFAFQDPREGGNNESGGPYLPTTCVIFNADNNYCQKFGVPGIPEFPKGGSWGVADPIVAAVRTATTDIINKKKTDCESRTDINREFLIAWLFNLYPKSYVLTTGQDSADPFPFTDGLDRIGVLPRMAILRARIDNFEEMLNLNLTNEGVSTISDSTMGEFRSKKVGAKTLDYFERPIQAFLSAKNNLPSINGENGNFANVELTELIPNLPASVEKNPFLKNQPVLAKFDDLVAKVTFANSKFNERSGFGEAGNCFQVREERVIPRFPFGVTKNPNVLTYYAVRLQAKARLLFSPFGGNGVVTLSAYSAAKPFGSRIGKDLNPEKSPDGARKMMIATAFRGNRFADNGAYETNVDIPLESSLAPGFPNVLVADNDGPSQTAGFTMQGHLGYIRGGTISLGRADLGPRLAGAYAPWEIGYYTPPVAYDQKEIIGLFEDNPFYNGGRFFALLGSVFPVNGQGGQDLSFIQERVRGYLVGDLKDLESLKGKFNDFLNGTDSSPGVLSNDKFASLFAYLQDSGQVYYHLIRDPMLGDEPELQAYARAVGQKYTVAGMPTNPYKRQLTSWNNEKTSSDTSDPSFGIAANSELGPDMGRSGYSVKFISFASLKAGGQATNDPDLSSTQWQNPLERFNAGGGDVNARILDDINKVKH